MIMMIFFLFAVRTLKKRQLFWARCTNRKYSLQYYIGMDASGSLAVRWLWLLQTCAVTPARLAMLQECVGARDSGRWRDRSDTGPHKCTDSSSQQLWHSSESCSCSASTVPICYKHTYTPCNTSTSDLTQCNLQTLKQSFSFFCLTSHNPRASGPLPPLLPPTTGLGGDLCVMVTNVTVTMTASLSRLQ